MKNSRQKGFVMIFIITLLALIAAEVYVLAGGANVIMFQANNAYLRACERNLAASAAAWAEKNQNKKNLPGRIELDIKSMDIPRAKLDVSIKKPQNKKTAIEINTSVSYGRNTIRRHYKF